MQIIKGKNQSVAIENGVIVGVDSANAESFGSQIAESSEVLDLKNALIAPQLIDLNVYPKNKSLLRTSILSLGEKAKRGGVGIIALNSASNPAIDNEMAMEFVKNINAEVAILPLISSNVADFGDKGANQKGDSKICDITILNALGGVGINIDSAKDANTIDKVAKYAKMLDIPLFINANDNLGGMINYGELSAKLGIPARSPLSEIKEVAKMLEVAIFYDIKVVFSAISEIRSLSLINEAKKHNPRIFAEVSIHHLILNESACENYNTSAKINPPLKDKKTREKLCESLQNGEIDLLTSLQCAHFNSKKELPFGNAEYGIDAIAHYFALLYSNLVATKIISLERLFEICAENPAKILNLNCGKIEQNKEARLMAVDLDSNVAVDGAFSPYKNADLKGEILRFI
ncbi:hypothetical protein [Helicobacter sp. 23-1045]